MIATRRGPNVLECGCELGPTYRDCPEAERLIARKNDCYRRMVTDRSDREAQGRYEWAKRNLELHYSDNGADECAPVLQEATR